MKSFTILASAFGLVHALPTSLSSSLLTGRQVANCPLYLPKDNFEYPHLIVPVSAVSPNASLGNTYNPFVSMNDISTIFNFDILPSRAGQKCTLYFALPTPQQLVTSSFTMTGPGTFQFAQLEPKTGARHDTTWNTQPRRSSLPPVTIANVRAGNSYKVWNGDCGSSGVMSWRMSSTDSCLWLFQDFNDCAIGAYIVFG